MPITQLVFFSLTVIMLYMECEFVQIFLALNAKEEYVFENLLCFALIGYALRLVLDSLFDFHRYNGGDVRDFTSSASSVLPTGLLLSRWDS